MAFRIESCLGGKVCGPSIRIRQLHNKFHVPTSDNESFWQPEDVFVDVPWPSITLEDTRTNDEWIIFCINPFQADGGYSS